MMLKSPVWLGRVLLIAICIFGGGAIRANPEIVGHVVDPRGNPIGGAAVFVHTASPTTGPALLCPSCYPDCGKLAKCDAAGRFTLSGLAPNFEFQLLVVADGHKPKVVPRVAPGGASLEIELATREFASAPPEWTTRGRVIDKQGAPIAWAVLERKGLAFEGGHRRWGGADDSDRIAVSNDRGEFVLASRVPLVAFLGSVSGRGYAKQNFELATQRFHNIRLARGGALTGRVTRDGQPLAHVSLGLSGQIRGAGHYVGHFETNTDEQGRFALTHLPPQADYWFYGLMESIGLDGVLPIRPVHVGRDGEVTDIGDIAVQPGFRLSGRVVVDDGATLPADAKLVIGREQAWDSLTVALGANGEFEVTGLPAETLRITLGLPGYRISAKNGSYDVGQRALVGRVDGDISDFVLLLEKLPSIDLSNVISTGIPQRPVTIERPHHRPLRGAKITTP